MQTFLSNPPRLTFRQPACYWRREDMVRRAYLQVQIAKLNGSIVKTVVTISRSFQRGGERQYANITSASLARVSRLFPFPII